jgi:hypothetical protein
MTQLTNNKPNKRRAAKAYHVWKTSTRSRTVKRAGLRWMRFTHRVGVRPQLGRVSTVEVGEQVEQMVMV